MSNKIEIIGDFNCGFARIKTETGENFMSRDGKILLKEDVLKAFDFVEDIARICTEEDVYNFVNTNGEKICKHNYFYATDFKNGVAFAFDPEFDCKKTIDKNGNVVKISEF